ncbi:MAG: hypothetical protein M1819_001405 [Sarea resinae]|nr:MAG: hypothetical protein M1819_001405 [Sarea resinae]
MLDLLSSDSLSWSCPSDNILLPQIYHFKDRVVRGSFYVIDRSPAFVPLDTKTILEKRDLKAGPHGSALARAYCMSTLRSYPDMMCRDDGTLPPFIHLLSRPSICKTDSKRVDDYRAALPEPLAICSSIMRMYMARAPGNLAFIWRTIQAESRRIEDEYRSYDTWNTLASIQAMTTYLILGLLDDCSEYAADQHILMPLLSTTKRMADKLRPVFCLCNEEIQSDQIPAWEEWALVESRRRTAIILVIIIHLFSIEHASGLPQCGGFAELLLPCSKTLWQAPDQATWETEYRKQHMRCSSFGESSKRILTYRDLLPDLQDQNDPTSASRMGYLSEWFSGMDDFGTLVTMAISTL